MDRRKTGDKFEEREPPKRSVGARRPKPKPGKPSQIHQNIYGKDLCCSNELGDVPRPQTGQEQ
jgi:hypothetical protein